MSHPFDDDQGDEPAETEHDYYARQASTLRSRLATNPPTDPELRARLERDLEAFDRAAAAAEIPGHWASGEGDRRLF